MTNLGHYHTDSRLIVIMTNLEHYHTDSRLTVTEFLTKTINGSRIEVLQGCGLRTTLWLYEHTFTAAFRNVHLKQSHLY